ncbi:MAG: response regulator [Deltaproteobacteria bacterium]|nr:response regulator [Deltaproteobacteria bacterium]
MSLPHVLLVDDSDAVLAFERAALSGHCALSTASNGQEALEKVEGLRPDLVLLDLSMPLLDGGEALARIKADPALRSIPVLVLSSERSRAAECLSAGAAAFLEKPIKPEDLRDAVQRALEEAQREKRRGGMAVLFAGVGPVDFAVPLSGVREVHLQMLTRPLPTAPPFLNAVVEIHGEPVCVLDLGIHLGLARSVPLLERKLILLDCGGVSLALSVDRILDPEEVPPEEVIARERLGGAEHGPLQETLVGLVRFRGTHLPVLDPKALVSPELLARIPEMLRLLPNAPSAGGSP